MNISKSDIVNSFSDISDTFVRYVSKEGVGKFPTVVFLANKMFLSDDENIIKDLNLPYKIAVHDDYHWAKLMDFHSDFSELMDKDKRNILNGVKMFKTKDDIGYNIKKIFNVSNTLNYYITANNELLYGSTDKFGKIDFNFKDTTIAEFPSAFTTSADTLATIKAAMALHGFNATSISGNVAYSESDINVDKIRIFRQDNVDYMSTEHCVFKIDPTAKTVSLIYAYRNLADNNGSFDNNICFPVFRFVNVSGDNAAIATNKGCYSINGVSSGNWQFFTRYTHKSWTTQETQTTDDGNGGTKTETVTVHHSNGMPTNNDINFAYISGNSIYAGVFGASTASKFTIGSVQSSHGNAEDSGTEISNSLMNKEYTCGLSIENNGGTISIVSKGSMTGVNGFPLSACIDETCVYLTYADRIDCYSFETNKIAFTFTSVNNMPENGFIGATLDKNNSLLLFTENGTVYTMIDEKDDATISLITTDFVYDTNKDDKKLHCTVKKCSGRQLMQYLVSKDKFMSEICKIEGKDATFLIALLIKTNGQKVFAYFGDDTRNAVAKEIKSINSAFGIEP